MTEIKEILVILWQKRRQIIICLSVFLTPGVIIALATPIEWRADNTLITMSSSDSRLPSSIGGLATIVWINLGASNSSQINPESYADILSSSYFTNELVNTPFYSFNKPDSISLFKYHEEYIEQSLFSSVQSLQSLVFNFTATN